MLELASGSSHPRGLRVSAKVFFFSATEMVMVSHLRRWLHSYLEGGVTAFDSYK